MSESFRETVKRFTDPHLKEGYVKIFDCIEKAHFCCKDNHLGGGKLSWSDFFKKVLNECPDVFVHEKENRFQLFERYFRRLFMPLSQAVVDVSSFWLIKLL